MCVFALRSFWFLSLFFKLACLKDVPGFLVKPCAYSQCGGTCWLRASQRSAPLPSLRPCREFWSGVSPKSPETCGLRLCHHKYSLPFIEGARTSSYFSAKWNDLARGHRSSRYQPGSTMTSCIPNWLFGSLQRGIATRCDNTRVDNEHRHQQRRISGTYPVLCAYSIFCRKIRFFAFLGDIFLIFGQ